MTEKELDGLLLMAYFPTRKERLNLSHKDIFINTIIDKIIKNDLKSEFGENVIFFLPSDIKSRNETGEFILETFLGDMVLFKLAALKTFDDFQGHIK